MARHRFNRLVRGSSHRGTGMRRGKRPVGVQKFRTKNRGGGR